MARFLLNPFGSVSCSGNGASDTFTIDLTGSFGPDLQHLAVDLSDLSTKWQGSSPLSFELAGGPGSPGGTTPLPEPGTLALLVSSDIRNMHRHFLMSPDSWARV
jgi:hypothetical protein